MPLQECLGMAYGAWRVPEVVILLGWRLACVWPGCGIYAYRHLSNQQLDVPKDTGKPALEIQDRLIP